MNGDYGISPVTADMQHAFLASNCVQSVDDQVEYNNNYSLLNAMMNQGTNELNSTANLLPLPPVVVVVEEVDSVPVIEDHFGDISCNSQEELELSKTNTTRPPSISIVNYSEVTEEAPTIQHLMNGKSETDNSAAAGSVQHNSVACDEMDLKKEDQGCDDITACEEQESEKTATHRHSRLLRLLSNNETVAETISLSSNGEQISSTATTTSTKSDQETTTTATTVEEVFPPPPNLPGVRLRMRSKRARDRIPSRVFQSLQHDFDNSSTEDIHQAFLAGLGQEALASPLNDNSSSSSIHQGNHVLRFSRFYSSITPETPSSANSEMEGFFLPTGCNNHHPSTTAN